MAKDNPICYEKRIADELKLKIGIRISRRNHDAALQFCAGRRVTAAPMPILVSGNPFGEGGEEGIDREEPARDCGQGAIG